MNESNKLGQFLRQGRSSKGLTLRGVESATQISNAYLSQLESGKILKPSPVVLYKLCALYGVSYPMAMEYAGHPVPHATSEMQQSPSFSARFGPISTEEEDALVEYLDFLRSRRERGAR